MEYRGTGVMEEERSIGVMERQKEKKDYRNGSSLIRSTPILQYSNFVGEVFSTFEKVWRGD